MTSNVDSANIGADVTLVCQENEQILLRFNPRKQGKRIIT